MLELRDVSLSSTTHTIVKRANLRLESGRVMGLVGASGAGKSLLSLAILGLLPDAITLGGGISWRGQNISDATEAELASLRGHEIGIVFQNTSAALDPLITIGNQLASLFEQKGLTRQAACAEAQKIFKRVEWPSAIDPFDRYPHEVSGGQRQRALIAMAIALKPRLMIADEPTAALDVTTARAILELLRRLARDEGASLLIISHDLPALAMIADEIAYLHDGVIDQAHPVSALKDERVAPDLAALYHRSLLTRRVRPDKRSKTDPAIHMDHLSITHQAPRFSLFKTSDIVRAVNSVTATIHIGETIALVGESGSGKSTLARALVGLDRPRSGALSVLGLDPQNRATSRRLWQETRLVFQDPFAAVDPNWTVRDIIGEALALLDEPMDRAARDARITVALAHVGLAPDLADRFPHQMSGGQLQRVTLARALITEPKILILDEPISALDAEARGQILSLLADLTDRIGLTTILITHDLGVARAFADRVVVMKDGIIVEDGGTDDVLQRPKTAYTQSLLAASFTSDAKFEA